MVKHTVVLFVAALGLSACGAPTAPRGSELNSADGQGDGKPVVYPTPSPSPSAWGICGTLNFSDIIFPASLRGEEAKALALSLSVSGSFEGRTGWANLAGDGDGMGMSMGLLQQNLGSGTLQPLLLQLEKTSPSTLVENLASNDLRSLEAMLNNYQTASGIKISERETPALNNAEAELFPDADVLSPLDQDEFTALDLLKTRQLSGAEAASVQWAVTNVLSSTNVLYPQWKNAFTSIALSAPYRTLQVGAALRIFDRALGYFNAFGFTELKSLILMYDFVVQDGGFSAAHKKRFEAWTAANPSADETARTKELLNIRLATVNPAHRADVEARKLTIINGVGTVHGRPRDLQKDYCYKANEKI